MRQITQFFLEGENSILARRFFGENIVFPNTTKVIQKLFIEMHVPMDGEQLTMALLKENFGHSGKYFWI